MTNDITDPFDETGPCRECGEVDELRSGPAVFFCEEWQGCPLSCLWRPW